MPQPLAIPDDDILRRLRTGFGLDADAIQFLPSGYDVDAWVYRVHAGAGDRFLKIRRGPVDQAGLLLPRLLTERGIAHLIAPIPTLTGALFDDEDLSFILFPFIEGGSGGEMGMSSDQWRELGAPMRTIHELRPDGETGSILRTEDFEPSRIGMLRAVQERIDVGETVEDPARRELTAFWRSRQGQIDQLVARTETLAPIARTRAGPSVICHADIHAWNVLVTLTGAIVIVDWDSAMFPRENAI